MPAWWSATLRYLGLQSEPKALPDHGASAGIPVGQSYDATTSLSAMAAFPWVRACVDAIGTDLSGLPLRVVRGEGSQAVQVVVPALALLLKRPTSTTGRGIWERQLLVHLLLTGNAYLLKVGVGRQPTTLKLLHPSHVRVIPDQWGEPGGYEYAPPDGKHAAYAADAVVHIRLSNWEYGPQGLLGEGLIRPLNADLNADLNAAKMAAKASKAGRPTAVFSPSEAGDVWTKEMRSAIVDAYTKAAEGGAQAMALSSGMKVEFPAFTPRDMEYSTSRTLTRETVLAAFGVPPTRVGLPQANYATSREQAKTYWQSLIGLASLLDDALSSVAQLWAPDLRVVHDFSGVEALQESRDARLNRVASWVMLGASPADAAAYEGFDDAPVGELVAQAEPVAVGASVARAAPPAGQVLTVADWWRRALDPEEPRLEQSEYERPPFGYVRSLKADYPEIWGAGGNERGNEAFEYWAKYQDGDRSEGVLAWLKEREAWAARHYEDGDAFMGSEPESPTISNIGGVVAWLKWGVIGQLGWERIKSLIDALKGQNSGEEARATLWRGWLAEVQEPAERRLAIDTRAALRSQADKVAAAYGELALAAPMGLQRDADALKALLDRIFGPEVQAELARLTGEAYRAAVRAAFVRAAKQVSATLSPDRVEPLVEQLIAVMVANVNGSTRDMLAEIIATGLAEGATTADVQRRIQDAAGFSPMRALRIARTESTRSAAAGASYAWQIVSVDSGVSIRREWLSSRDSEVRDAHRDLDGQVVELGQPFSWNGKKAMNPGDFDDAALVVNCRCTVLPVVKE